VARQADLLQVVRALNATGCLARRLDGREQQGDQNCNDCDHNEQLNEREASA
jgi:hypothetical protein